jgi:cyclopropane-fatty-acyl-phospholipid synthase
MPMDGSGFMDRYVFPQGELPHIGMVLTTMQKGGLEAFDVELLRRHYAQTLRHWAENFETNADTIREMVGEKKFRIWRIYLAAAHMHSPAGRCRSTRWYARRPIAMPTRSRRRGVIFTRLRSVRLPDA